MPPFPRTAFVVWTAAVYLSTPALAAPRDLPRVPDGFRVQLFAREPMVRNPVSMAFDSRGRLFVAQGPQFRNPKPDTPGDTIRILVDRDEDGVADDVKTFARGFNSVHAMAWKGRDLWVANAPDLTIVRDLDGDDEADQYVLVYTDLGNIEHGLHGLVWGPDGKLYMSKGNSKGLTKPGRIAPKPFRDLWGVKAPPGSPDLPPPRVFTPEEYRNTYHNPADDWGREGGILRCDDLGENLEIVAQGFRNPWDIAFDTGFDWLGTDNDQTEGDKIFMPFRGAHFGWGHPWSANWKGADHLPTVPPSGPLFEGSGTGIVYYSSTHFPRSHNNVFFIDDWLRGLVYVFRPRWEGALMKNASPEVEVFASADGALFKPSDLEVGPDGALYILGWGREYGAAWKDGEQVNEGRIFRVACDGCPTVPREKWAPPKRSRPYAEWIIEELIEDLGHQIPAWRVDAQNELVRRGSTAREMVKERLLTSLRGGELSKAQETWLTWTIGRLAPEDPSVDELFASIVPSAEGRSLNLRLQALRIVAHRIREFGRVERLPESVAEALRDVEPRVRHEAVQAIWSARDTRLLDDLQRLAAAETDRVTFYAAWRALGELMSRDVLRDLLDDSRGGVRRAALLALLHVGALTKAEVIRLRTDPDVGVGDVASLWLSKVAGMSRHLLRIEPSGAAFAERVSVRIEAEGVDGTLRYTVDGSPPNARSPVYREPLEITFDTPLKAALFKDGRRVSAVREAKFHRLTAEELAAASLITDLRAESGRPYRFAAERLVEKARAYVDRDYTFSSVPEELKGVSFVMTSNDDSGSRGEAFLEFEALDDVVLALGHDVRRAEPRWMRAGEDGGFERTELEIATTDTRFRLFEKRFPAGRITLGGNTEDGDGGGVSNYVVIVQPAPLEPRENRTTVAEVVGLGKSGDATRGARTFFGAARCDRCHRVGGRGNAFAPDLSDIGARVTYDEIVRSVIEPSARIVEGFRTHVIVTKRGTVHTGVVIEETGLSFRLVNADGEPTTIDKQDVLERSSAELSAMPDVSRLLSPQRAADLAAYLATRRERAKGGR